MLFSRFCVQFNRLTIGCKKTDTYWCCRHFLLMGSVAQGVHQTLFIRESLVILYTLWLNRIDFSCLKKFLDQLFHFAQIWLLKRKICMVLDICCRHLLPWVWCYHSQWSTEPVDFFGNWLRIYCDLDVICYLIFWGFRYSLYIFLVVHQFWKSFSATSEYGICCFGNWWFFCNWRYQLFLIILHLVMWTFLEVFLVML